MWKNNRQVKKFGERKIDQFGKIEYIKNKIIEFQASCIVSFANLWIDQREKKKKKKKKNKKGIWLYTQIQVIRIVEIENFGIMYW